MSILIAIQGWEAEPWRKRLRTLLPNRAIALLGEDYDRDAIRYVLSWRHPAGALANLRNLKAIFSLGAGVDHLFADPLLPDRPIARIVDPDLRDRMSEWVVMNALMHLRRAPHYAELQRKAIWLDDDDQPCAADVSVGILGFGVLGQDAAAKLKMMGFPVAAWSASEKSAPGIVCRHGAAGLDALLAQTEILVALLPLTPQTRGILNRDLFAKLRRGGRLGGPILINGGRGGLQVEADILAALDEGRLAGASLDVFETEPLPPDSPLWKHPRILITPHNAAMSAPTTIAAGVARQIEACDRGEPLINLVDRARGY